MSARIIEIPISHRASYNIPINFNRGNEEKLYNIQKNPIVQRRLEKKIKSEVRNIDASPLEWNSNYKSINEYLYICHFHIMNIKELHLLYKYIVVYNYHTCDISLKGIKLNLRS